MARLTEQEIELIRRAKFTAQINSIDTHEVLAEAQRLKAETLAHLLGQATRWIARTTGLAALGRVLSRSIITPLRRAALRRRTMTDLQQLDNRLLSDIGLKRENIGDLATQLSQASVPSTDAEQSAMWGWIRRWRTRRELEALSDHVLHDIGISRSEIPTRVYQLFGQDAVPVEGAVVEPAPSPGTHSTAVLRGILGILRGRVRSWRTRRELEALSDHVLNDIGIRRSGIPALAKQLHGHVGDIKNGTRVPAGPSNAKVHTLADFGLASLPPAMFARLMKHAA